MSELGKYSCVLLCSVLVSSISQIMLKKSAQKNYNSKILEYCNPLVIIAYSLFFCCNFLSLFALKVVPLSMSPILESSGYIFVSILSYIFLKEKLTKKQIFGILLILIGIGIYTLNVS